MVHGDFSEGKHNLHVSHVFAILLETEDDVRSILGVHEVHVDLMVMLNVVVIEIGISTLMDSTHLGANKAHFSELLGFHNIEERPLRCSLHASLCENFS